jgi:hypothetical protein
MVRIIPLALAFVLFSYGSWADLWDVAGDDTGAGATALIITTNLQTHGTHTLTNGVDDADWFSFFLEAGKRYRLETTGDFDTQGYLYYDPEGNSEVDYQDYQTDDAGVDFNFQILFTPSISQTYYLQVAENQNGGVLVEYDLNYVNEPVFDEWDSADDSYTNGSVLVVESTEKVHGEHKLSPADHDDWFRVQLFSGAEYVFETTGGWDTSALLYSSNLVELVDSRSDWEGKDDAGEGTNFRITFTPSYSGVYYLLIQAYDPGYDISYSLKYLGSNLPAGDDDEDGMLDAWEITHFGSTNALPGEYGDTDPFSNLEEYIADTDPLDSESWFAVTNSGYAGGMIISWHSAVGREYRVLWTDSPTSSFEPIPGVVVEHPQNSYTDTLHSAESANFYKVRVNLK